MCSKHYFWDGKRKEPNWESCQQLAGRVLVILPQSPKSVGSSRSKGINTIERHALLLVLGITYLEVGV